MLPCACGGRQPPRKRRSKWRLRSTRSSSPRCRTTDWITNGGTLFNQRYSPLQLLNRDNVAGLKALWRTGMGSGTGARLRRRRRRSWCTATRSTSSTARTTCSRWTWRPARSCGPTTAIPTRRAAARIGRAEPRRRARRGQGVRRPHRRAARGARPAHRQGHLDDPGGALAGRLRDHCGAAVLRRPRHRRLQRRRDGRARTHQGLRRQDRQAALDVLHRARPRASPVTRPGRKTATRGSAAAPRSGRRPRSIRSSGLLYFSTGNPGPDLHGDVRPGDNLFIRSRSSRSTRRPASTAGTSSRCTTTSGTTTRPIPVVLFDAQIDGKPRKGLVEVSKTGWAYILDRVTGKPLIGIERTAGAAGAAPGHRGDAALSGRRRHRAAARSTSSRTARAWRPGRPSCPTRAASSRRSGPSPSWPSPARWAARTGRRARTIRRRTCCMCAPRTASAASRRARSWRSPGPNKVYMGGAFGQAQVADAGILAALDVTHQPLVWRQQWREICYSGSVVTAGGLLFVGRADGRLTALDKSQRQPTLGVHDRRRREHHRHDVRAQGQAVRRRARRWRTVRERQARRWHLDVLPRRQDSLADPGGCASRRLPAAVRAARPAAGPPPPPPAPTRAANVANGAKIYKQACVPCHGATGEGGEGGGAPLVNGLTRESILSTTTTGKNNMPSFTSSYSTRRAQRRRDVSSQACSQSDQSSTRGGILPSPFFSSVLRCRSADT